MKAGKLPKATKAALTGEAGVSRVTQRLLVDLGWLLRRTHQEHDFGIDGHVDIIDEAGAVTGRQFAVQIKYGNSYLHGSTSSTITYRGQLKHLNYYLNYPLPVILIVSATESEDIFWAHLDPAQTQQAGASWTLEIPRHQRLVPESRAALVAIAGPSLDYTDALDEYWKENRYLAQFNTVLLGVSRREIEEIDVSYFSTMFTRLLMNSHLARQLEGKVGLFIQGYEDDPRELWEVPEVRQWMMKAQPVIKYWFYFLPRHPYSSSLLLFGLCSLPVSRLSDGGWEVDFPASENWFKRNYSWLNEMIARVGLSDEENMRISKEVVQCFFPGYEPED
jgi:hypothetical protein